MPADFSLIIPTYNENKNIPELYSKLTVVLNSLGLDSEIIIVDDNSPDETWRVAEELARQDKRVKVIRRMQEKGLASAVVNGWSISQGEILGVIDGDLQHPPELLKDMINKMLVNADADIVVASRYAEGGGFLNRDAWQNLRSWLAKSLVGVFLPKICKLVKDPMSGYFVLRRRVIESRPLTPLGYKILLEVLVKGSYRKVYEIPYVFAARGGGRAKSGWRQCFISLLHLLRLKSRQER
jgi:dolichol-phosphate mannosyltransferase